MCQRLDTYSLLVDKFGEETAYKICEELGGTTIEVPKKAHKVYRVGILIEKALPLIQIAEKQNKTKITNFVKKLAATQGVQTDCVYKRIRKARYGK